MPAEPVLPPTKMLRTNSERQSRKRLPHCHHDCHDNDSFIAQCHGVCSLSLAPIFDEQREGGRRVHQVTRIDHESGALVVDEAAAPEGDVGYFKPRVPC